jgi:predicted Zn finger-like uncharacterized protein
MSLITTCPACGTAFRVTPEQLSAHRGDVRCGQCQHIFSALKHLAEVTPAALPAQPLTTGVDEALQTVEPETQPSVEFAETTETVETDFEPPADTAQEPALSEDRQEIALPFPEEIEAPIVLDTPENTEELLVTNSSEPEAVSAIDEPTGEPIAAAESIPPESPPLEAESVAAEVNETVEIAAEEPGVDTPAPSEAAEEEPVQVPRAEEVRVAAAPAVAGEPFARPKKRSSRWLAPLAVLLLLAAGVQSAYFLRTEIAARVPQAKPWLVAACRPLHCTVELPRQDDLLSIEDSDLQDDPEHEGVLVLSSTLHNRAPYAQAYPLLEITLTDTFDKPVLRRTLEPKEYLSAGTILAEGIAAGSETSIRLHLGVDGTKPAGYRLYVKY